MPVISTKSVTETIDRSYDGLRILVCRHTPQGVKKTRWDVWMANLAPSDPLRKAFRSKKIDWKEFSRRYKDELFEPTLMDEHNGKSKNYGQKFTLRLIKHLAKRQKITLMCTCGKEEEYCHRYLLRDVINSTKV